VLDRGTGAVFITRNGKDLYAANTRADRSQPGDVGKLDAPHRPSGVQHHGRRRPERILVPNGRVGYVSGSSREQAQGARPARSVPVLTGREALVGTQPDTLQLARDGTLVVTLRGTPAQISLMDTRTFAVRTVDIPGHMTTGHHWLSAGGRFSYVAGRAAGRAGDGR
jgi:hypothetical protein